MKIFLRLISLPLLLFTGLSPLAGQPVLDHWFWPGTSLPGAAETSLLPLTSPLDATWPAFMTDPLPVRVYGHLPTDRTPFILTGDEVPDETFSVEFWLLDHVNRPVGVAASLRDPSQPYLAGWNLGYYDHSFFFDMQGLTVPLTTEFPRGFKKYFFHVVAVADGENISLFINGRKQAEIRQPDISFSDLSQIELSGYFEQEPFMTTGHLLKHIRIWDEAISEEYIQDHYEQLCLQTEQGVKLPETFHLTAGPYLFRPTQRQIEILWETNEAAAAVVRVGKTADSMREIKTISTTTGLGHIVIDSLEPETRYFYDIDWTNEAGQSFNSGVLSFATAVKDSSAWAFAVCGDPEARPHINQRMSELIWEERPNFLLNLGDLTDGGKAPHRFEWTYEYFAGMGALHQRIPVFPLAGNGESDLVWYRHYHGMKEDAPAYYTFPYGNAQFFILNSNEKEELKPGGKQFEWLEEQLAASSATWKFVAHHHAPFSSDENDYGNTWEQSETDMGDLKVRALVPLYEKYGVDIVFFGHLHMYERTWPIRDLEVNPEYGVVYLVSGGAGGNLEDFAPTRSGFTTKLYRGHHYNRIDIWGGKLFFKMYDLNGALKDYMELEK